MNSLVGYGGSDDENESERCYNRQRHYSGSSGAAGGSRRRDDDNYEYVNMDLSEGSESEPELPPAEPHDACSARVTREDRRGSDDSRDRERDRRRESPPRARSDRERDRERDRDRANKHSPRRDDKYSRSDARSDRSDRSRGSHDSGSSRRGLLGDRPEDRPSDSKVPALMDLKPFGGEPPPSAGRSQDTRDAVSPRFVDRGDRREREKERERDKAQRETRDRGRESRDRERERESHERERERHGRRSEERRSAGGRYEEHRARSRGAVYPPPGPPHPSSSSERRGSPPSGDYRPSSYKVNKKLEVMEKMGLQIKTPDGSMATAQQLRAAAGEAPPQHARAAGGLPSYYNPTAVNTNKILDQVQKRKLLWSNKNKCEAEEAAKWSGTRFAQDSDGRQASKFMRLMGIKDQAAVKPESTDRTADPIKKQEELFQAMQAQYEVARATTHTMRGVGLGFQRGQY